MGTVPPKNYSLALAKLKRQNQRQRVANRLLKEIHTLESPGEPSKAVLQTDGEATLSTVEDFTSVRKPASYHDFAGFSVSPFSPWHPLCEQAPVDVESNILLPPHPHYSEDYWWLAGSVALVLQQCPWYKLQITRTVKVQRKDDVACTGKPSEDAEATRILATGSSDGNKTQVPAQLPAHSSEASWILDGGIALLSSTAHKFESLWGSVGVEIVRHVVSRYAELLT
ncbi:hypothetical protein B0H13DRAFT_1907469 [Mycena leptocephala]|nr:hypothetical protein B0H13DRAFT_1907469 [Mycena leptocephala]